MPLRQDMIFYATLFAYFGAVCELFAVWCTNILQNHKIPSINKMRKF